MNSGYFLLLFNLLGFHKNTFLEIIKTSLTQDVIPPSTRGRRSVASSTIKYISDFRTCKSSLIYINFSNNFSNSSSVKDFGFACILLFPAFFITSGIKFFSMLYSFRFSGIPSFLQRLQM